MSPRELFGLVLRSFGLLLLYNGISFGFSAVDVVVHDHDPWGFKPETYVLTTVWSSVLGFYLLRGAPLLLDFAYPPSAEDRRTVADDEPVSSTGRESRSTKGD